MEVKKEDKKNVDFMKYLRKIEYNSPVILTFVLATVIIYWINLLTNGGSNHLLFSVYRSSFLNLLTYVRLIGHVFGHASWDHLMGNILLILVIGPMLEEKYGSKRILLFILSTAVITGMFHIIFFKSALLGASGIVFMLILLSSITRISEQRIPLTLILVAITYIGSEIVNVVIQTDQISQITHIVGGICGAVFGFLYHRKRGIDTNSK